MAKFASAKIKLHAINQSRENECPSENYLFSNNKVRVQVNTNSNSFVQAHCDC